MTKGAGTGEVAEPAQLVTGQKGPKPRNFNLLGLQWSTNREESLYFVYGLRGNQGAQD